MIIALLAVFFLAGGVSGVSGSMLTPEYINQLSKRVDTVVSDPARASAAQQTLAELNEEAERFQKIFLASGEQLDKAYRDHSGDGSEAGLILDELNADWALEQQRAFDLRFKLKESVSKQEWAELFAFLE
jgi:hypothetical protein